MIILGFSNYTLNIDHKGLADRVRNWEKLNYCNGQNRKMARNCATLI